MIAAVDVLPVIVTVENPQRNSSTPESRGLKLRMRRARFLGKLSGLLLESTPHPTSNCSATGNDMVLLHLMARPRTINRAAVVSAYKSGLSHRAVSREMGVSIKSCMTILKEAGALRPLSIANRMKFPGIDSKWDMAVSLYRAGYSCDRISPMVGYNAAHVRKIIRRAGLSRTPQEAALNRPVRQPRISISPEGYETFRIGRKRIFVHRLIAEFTIGRPLKRGEVVHHRNGIRTDNRPENLEVMTISEHMYIHGKERGGINLPTESISPLRSADC